MLKTTNLTFQYPGGGPLRFPDLEVGTGQALLILGESGCGKTTLLHLLAGLLRPAAGEVLVGGSNLAAMSPAQGDRFRGQYIGLVYQKPYFIESLTVLDNLLVSPFSPKNEKAAEVAQRLGIGALLHKLPGRLSVGEQQRATIARAVMSHPKLLLADEPTSALDHRNCATVIRLLKEEAAANNAALIIVTHDDRLKREIGTSYELQAASREP
ncbi:MAG: ATP-binding cassette domain-containing protein [Saprospiraceae bacterium]|nr:ATP-binding cassette domain-containing protein [Saprospiraceae bacterium]